MLGGMMQSIGVGGTIEASELNLLTGNVGIGTASPTLTYGGKGLHIENNDNAEILLNDTTGATFSIAARDSDVLLYSANTDPIRIGVGGDEKMRIENSGNVGIGTATPGAKLDVNGDLRIGTNVWHTSSDGRSRMYYTAGGTTFLRGSDIQFRNNGDANLVTIKDSGNVGIGTTEPASKLQVALGNNEIAILNDGTNASGIWGTNIGFLSQSSQAQITTHTGVPLVFHTGGTRNSMTEGSARMTIATTGNVGIGTVSPSAKLHVNGDVIFGEGSTLTIASGAITPTHAFHQVATESNASTDDLVTINGAYTGKMLILKALVTGKTIVLKDTGGNLRLAGGDFSMDNGNDLITLMGVGSIWYEISRSDNA